MNTREKETTTVYYSLPWLQSLKYYFMWLYCYRPQSGKDEPWGQVLPSLCTGCPSNVLEKQVCEQGVEYISMKENKTMAKTFVTSASRRVNCLYKIINETVLVYRSACEAGSWMHTINIANALRIFGTVCGVCTLRWKLFIAIVSKSGKAGTGSKLAGSA